jgi:hypothetical protein
MIVSSETMRTHVLGTFKRSEKLSIGRRLRGTRRYPLTILGASGNNRAVRRAEANPEACRNEMTALMIIKGYLLTD